jgi:hypothetical protein
MYIKCVIKFVGDISLACGDLACEIMLKEIFPHTAL